MDSYLWLEAIMKWRETVIRPRPIMDSQRWEPNVLIPMILKRIGEVIGIVNL